MRGSCRQIGSTTAWFFRGHGTWEKRLRGVVIDAKVVALLKEAWRPADIHETLKAATGLPTRTVQRRDAQNAIKCFLKLVRSSIASRRSSFGAAKEPRSSPDSASYLVHVGRLQVGLGAMRKHGTPKGQCDRKTVIVYVNIIKWYLDSTA